MKELGKIFLGRASFWPQEGLTGVGSGACSHTQHEAVFTAPGGVWSLASVWAVERGGRAQEGGTTPHSGGPGLVLEQRGISLESLHKPSNHSTESR